MLTFQLIVVPVLCAAALCELRIDPKSSLGDYRQFARLLIWIVGIVLVCRPQITDWIARAIGITRGSDLVIYVFMLFALRASFQLYTRQFILQQRIAHLSRRDALENAQRGSGIRDR